MSKTSLPRRPRMIGPRQTIAIIASIYNDEFVSALIKAAQKELEQLVPQATVPLLRVPGAYEIPVCAQYLAKHGNPDVIIALGVVIRGETAHADLVASSVCDSLQRVATENLVPIVNEVLLLNNAEQAKERCMGTRINRGVEAARAAAGMAEMFQKLQRTYAPEKSNG
ncbi:MAG: 6,7-dimethyl-8-ribityllumazine synthase [Verrucomicrobiota bacterium]